jgi:hypothetical protein
MIKEEKKTEIKEVCVVTKHKFCDVCGDEIKIGMVCSVAKCEQCGKDLCNKCIGHEVEICSDYRREVYCEKCWDIGEPFRKEIEELEGTIERLNDEWLKLCK